MEILNNNSVPMFGFDRNENIQWIVLLFKKHIGCLANKT